MNPSPKNFSRLHVALFGGAIATTAALSLFGPSVRAALQESPKSVVDEAWQIVNREYVDGTFNQVDWQATRQDLLSKNYATREEAYKAIRVALEKLEDPYTRFLDPKQYQALTSQTSGELSGVGLKLELDEKTKDLTVVEPIENSPALKAGIKPGDKILAINGKTTKGMSVEAAANLIRGEVGTKVTLKISSEGRDKDVALTRAQIELAAVRSSVKQEGKIRVGYIRLNEFSAHAAEQMRRSIKTLNNDKVDAFVLDLRGNPGGLLHSSVEIAQMWMDKGAIVRTVDRKGANEEFKTNGKSLTQLPLAVLVDGNSASASEILSGALKDNGRAKIIGSQTFGKALVQSVHSLSDGSGLAVTIAHYYTPKGTDISQKGVTPDVKIDLNDDQRKRLGSNPTLLGTQEDPQYARAIAELENTKLAQPGKPQLPRSLSVR
ncbi:MULTISPECIES: carboxyl-terminal processing protease CtpB [Cyanophyceae]|uniref:carboxyl-terminal processing protease CtpB n=1 Tax=Cyanophyceae TaxID=3028117 RepID=UPI001686FB47|nr:carboxyl-terminal processing protease CtpB [Trichocoleus sp. FACHB-69]MBD1932864.1 PDZ domain-containing protein [Trichocoleus sp. FACHB-69]